jgi:hypothetical protein
VCIELNLSQALLRRMNGASADQRRLDAFALERIRVEPVVSNQYIHHLPLDLNLLEQQHCGAFCCFQVGDRSDFSPDNLCIEGAS